MRKRLATLFGFVPFLLVAACTKQEKTLTPDPDLLAVVGTHEIRLPEFRETLRRRGGQNPDKEELLQEMIELEILAERARDLGLDQDPEVILAYRNLLIGMLRQKELDPLLREAKVEEREIVEEYRNRISSYTRPAARKAAMIFFALKKNSSEDAREKVLFRVKEARRLALESPDQFPAIVARFSDDQATRFSGGEIGWLESGKIANRIPDMVCDSLFALENPGDLSAVIESDEGFYLVKLIQKRPQSTVPLETVSETIRSSLLATKRAAIEKDYRVARRETVEIQQFPEALHKVEEVERSTPSSGPPDFP